MFVTLFQVILKLFKLFLSILNLAKDLILSLFLIFLLYSFCKDLIPSNLFFACKENSLLILDIKGSIVDKPPIEKTVNLFDFSFFENRKFKENSLFDIINIIRQAKDDRKISGMILYLDDLLKVEFSSLKYIGKVLNEFKNSGKKIISIGKNYEQHQYYLSSYADKIFLIPKGFVNLRGIFTRKFFFKTLFDNLKINRHIFRVGIYKSAIEPFIRDKMSDVVKKEEKYLVHHLWNQYIQTISKNRNIPIKKIYQITNNLFFEVKNKQGDMTKLALDNHLVDQISSYEEIEHEMTKFFKLDKKNCNLSKISFYNYHNNGFLKNPYNEGKIAVISVHGPIIDGYGTKRFIGGDDIVDKIRYAKFNDKIKAIVVRVNSPGGSVHASEAIREELSSVRNLGKPIIISMGNIAASGGYWISTPANYIIADSNTLTGSIGVFGIFCTVESSLNSLGIYSDGVSTSSIADISPYKKLSNEFLRIVQFKVENEYKNFLNLVSESRKKSIDEIEKIAQGHVWIGEDAIKNGLVDCVGDFDDAIKKASELVNLEKFTLDWNLTKNNIVESIMINFLEKIYSCFSTYFQNSFLYLFFLEIEKIFSKNLGLFFIWNDPENLYSILEM